MGIVRIELLGCSFTIQSDEDPAYLKDVVRHFSQKIEEVSSSIKTSDPLKISILAGLLASDEYLKLKSTRGNSEVARITGELISELEQSLSDDEPSNHPRG